MKNLIIGGIIRLGTMVGCLAGTTAAKDMHPSDARFEVNWSGTGRSFGLCRTPGCGKFPSRRDWIGGAGYR